MVVLVLPTLVRLAAEWPWFSALGYERVFATRLVAGALLGLAVGGAAFALAAARADLRASAIPTCTGP